MSNQEYEGRRNQIVELLTPIVESHNKMFRENYRIDVSTNLHWISIRSGKDSFNGCLLKDIAALSTVYSWAFGIYSDKDGLYVVL